MATYDNKSINGSGLTYFWTTIKSLILGWISPKQDHTLTGTTDASKVLVTDANKNIVTSSSITTTELGYLDGVTGNIQTQLNGKISYIHDSGKDDDFNTVSIGNNFRYNIANNVLSISAAPFFGSVEQAKTTSAKTCSIDNYSSATGNVLILRFRYDCGANATLSVSNYTAKPIRYQNSAITDGVIFANDLAMFVFTGDYYELVGVLPKATTSILGGVKAAGVRASAITTTQGGTTAGRYYGVELDSNGKAFVNVPWSETDVSGKQDKIKVGSATSGAVTTISAGSNISITISGSTATLANTYAYTLPLTSDTVLGGVYVSGTTPTADIDYFDGFIAEGGHLMIPVAEPYGPGDNAVAGVISATDIRMLYTRAPLASPTFTGHPECASAPTANTHLTNKTYVDGAIASAISGSTQFQGTINYVDSDTTHSELIQHGDFKAGEYWLVNTTGTVAGQTCEAGDMVYCITTHTHTAGTAITTSNFAVVQRNVDYLTNSDIDAIIAAAS